MKFGKIKSDTPVPLLHVIPDEKKQGKMTSKVQEKAHTNIIPDPESTKRQHSRINLKWFKWMYALCSTMKIVK